MAYEKSTSETKRRPALNTQLERLRKLAESDNIAEDLDETELANIGKTVVEEYEIDLNSRSDWEETATKAMDVALQVAKPKNYPFQGAANIKWPLLLVAASQFNARSYPEICSDAGIVKAKVVGKDDGVPQMQGDQPVVDPETGEPVWQVPPGAKAERAERISEHMSYQLSEEDAGWEDDMDTLLMQLPIVGDVVKKVYRSEDANVSEMIPAIDFIVNQNTKSLAKCPRMTHRFKLYPYEIEERKADGRYLDEDYQSSVEGDNDEQHPHEMLEQHRRMVFKNDDGEDKLGLAVPVIVTVHKESQKVCRIVANFEPEDIVTNDKRVVRVNPGTYFVNFIFMPDPKGGFYGVGFGQLLGPISAAIDTTFNQMLDAGHLQNAGGGFIGSGVRLKKSVLRMNPGEYHQVQSSGDNLRDSIVNMEHPGPSAVLFNLLGLMIEAAKDITAVKDILTGDSPQGETATTTLARIEQGLKVFTAIYKRVYRALKQEFKLRFRLNARYLGEQEYYNILDTTKAVSKADYNEDDFDVAPQADPRLVTDMQRLKRAEALLGTIEINQSAATEILKRYYTAIGAEDVESLLPKEGPDPAQQLAMEDAVAEVEKKKADTGLAVAKTEQTLASIGQEDARQSLAGLEAVDRAQQHDDHVMTERANLVSQEEGREQDREQQGELAKQSARAKSKGQAPK